MSFSAETVKVSTVSLNAAFSSSKVSIFSFRLTIVFFLIEFDKNDSVQHVAATVTGGVVDVTTIGVIIAQVKVPSSGTPDPPLHFGHPRHCVIPCTGENLGRKGTAHVVNVFWENGFFGSYTEQHIAPPNRLHGSQYELILILLNCGFGFLHKVIEPNRNGEETADAFSIEGTVGPFVKDFLVLFELEFWS